MAFDLVDLQLFVQVVDSGSITEGARRCHLSLPSASARVRLMERELGTSLLQRHRRGVHPSAAGQQLLGHARTVIGQLTRMRGDLAAFADGMHADVTLLANTAAASTFLPDALIRFLAEHPDTDVALEERSSQQIVGAIAEGRAELGVVADTVELGLLHTLPLRPDPVVAVTTPVHPLTTLHRVAFAECLTFPFVGLVDGNPFQEHLGGRAQPLGLRPRYRARLSDPDAICRAVAAGIGVAVLPAAVVSRSRRELAITTIPLTDSWADRRLLLCTTDPGRLSSPARALAAHLTHELRDVP